MFLITSEIIIYLLRYSLLLFQVTQLSTSWHIYTMLFLKLLILEKRYVQSLQYKQGFWSCLAWRSLKKLEAAGISGNLLLWLRSYLSDRHQRVVRPGAESAWKFIQAGVLQGSILGPSLFLLFINDIVTDIGSNNRLFVDDTSLFIIVENPDTAAELLNLDLEKILTWAKTWLVSFNPKETEYLLISRKQNKHVHPPLLMDNQVITDVDSHKHLGVFLSNDCTWHKHIDYVKENAWGRMNVMRCLKICLDRKCLETIYLTFIILILEYADVVWDNCTNYEKQELDKI